MNIQEQYNTLTVDNESGILRNDRDQPEANNYRSDNSDFENVHPEEDSKLPALMSTEVIEQIAEVNDVIAQIDGLDPDAFRAPIKKYATQASMFSNIAVQSSASSLVFACACGKLLNAAKAKLGRGAFGFWREDQILSPHMSERTSQRYMKLALKHDNPKGMLQWVPNLRQAYIACGVLPEGKPKDTNNDHNESAKTQALLASFSGLQKNLRLFLESKEKIDEADLNQFKLMKEEIDRFFAEVTTLKSNPSPRI